MRLAIIQVRDRSTRLPGKGTLQFSDGVTVIEQVVIRAKLIENVDMIAIAMPCSEKADPLGKLCRELEAKHGVFLHYGHDTDLFRRYYETARALFFNGAPPTQILRITADDPFRDKGLEARTMSRLCDGFDYAYTYDYPEGVNAEGFSIDFLAYAFLRAGEREHLTNYFLREYNRGLSIHSFNPMKCSHSWGKYRATLDTPADWEIIQRLYDAKGRNNTAADIVTFLKREEQNK